jgi:hypothetical protein
MYFAHRMVFASTFASVLVFAPCLSFAHGSAYTAYLVDRAPVVDGELDDAVWDHAPESEPFVIYGSGEEPEHETRARILYDTDVLYMGIRCQEPKTADVIHSFLPDDPGSWRDDDTIEIFLDPLGTHSHFCQFIFNADGSAVSGYDTDFQNPLPHKAAGFVGDGFWSLEVRIPFSTLRHTPTPGDFWAMNICRTRQAKGEDDKRELTAWNRTPGGFQKPGNFGTLMFGAAPALGEPRFGIGRPGFSRIMQRLQEERMGKFRWGSEDMTAAAAFDRKERLLRLARFLEGYHEELLWFVRKPIRDTRIYPWTVPDPREIGYTVRVRACRGEYEPATFAVFPVMDPCRLLIEVSDLTLRDVPDSEPAAVLSSDIVDVREVKCWYQSGAATMRPDKTTLLPELLLHDPSIVDVDPKERKNTLNFDGYPKDADTFQGTSIPAFESRQFWVTVRVPENAEPGVYQGSILLSNEGMNFSGIPGVPVYEIPLEVEVLDFELEPSPMIHSLYYTRRLNSGGGEESFRRQMEMMEGEIHNQVEHGINAPSTYVHNGNLPWEGEDGKKIWDWLIEVHREAGVPDDSPFFHVTFAVGTQQEEEQLENIRRAVRKSVGFLKERGRPNLYVQGKDEAPPDVMRKERKSFQAVNDAGGKVFVACGSDYFDAAGDVLNLPVVGGRLRKDLAEKVHEEGHKILVYANPWGGFERPEVYRRNYGIRLWLADYDGVMNWQYADTGTNAWDDFKGNSRRYNMAYPALGRPVDTIQWEGFREGVDDLRYLFTLLKYLEEAEEKGDRSEMTGEIRSWLNSLEGTEDLNEVRDRMIGSTRRLCRS